MTLNAGLQGWTEINPDPFTGRPCFTEKTVRGREKQKRILAGKKNLPAMLRIALQAGRCASDSTHRLIAFKC